MDLCAWKLGALLVASGLVGCAGSTVSPCVADGSCDTLGAGGDTWWIPRAAPDRFRSAARAQPARPPAAKAARPEPRDQSAREEPVEPVDRAVALVDAGKPFASRVVAYLPTYRGLDTWASQLDSPNPHVDLAFANPTSGNDPTLGKDSDPAVSRIVAGAHAKGVRVLISIGGASGGSERIAALLIPQRTSVRAEARRIHRRTQPRWARRRRRRRSGRSPITDLSSNHERQAQAQGQAAHRGLRHMVR